MSQRDPPRTGPRTTQGEPRVCRDLYLALALALSLALSLSLSRSPSLSLARSLALSLSLSLPACELSTALRGSWEALLAPLSSELGTHETVKAR